MADPQRSAGATDDDPAKTYVLEQQAVRYRLLRLIWEMTRDKPVGYGIGVLRHKLGIPIHLRDLDAAITYLFGERLLQDRHDCPRISHKGIVEVEASILKPAEGTEHFDPVIIQIFHAQVGAVNTATQISSDVRQESAMPVDPRQK
jgi:hypothetical protein